MKIKAIKIENFIGVKEFNYNPSNITILQGPKGSGKSSVLEAIETAVSNTRRRTEVVSHGADESTLFIETDSGLEIDRKVRTEKADYLKLRQEGTGIKSTEAELRRFLSGDIFRPLDFINLTAKEQTAIILNMIKMDYTPEVIKSWFASDTVLSGINTDKHLLQVLKDIETKTYAERQEVNREISTLTAQARGIEQSLPDNYDGESWRTKSLQEYYNKVSEAQKVNNYIDEALALKANIEEKTVGIESEKQNQINQIKLKNKAAEQDIKDIIDLSKGRIVAAENIIKNSDMTLKVELSKLDDQKRKEIEAIETKYYELSVHAKLSIQKDNETQTELIEQNNKKINAKEVELIGLSEKESIEIQGVENEFAQKIETEKARVGKASTYLENHSKIDIAPLQKQAEEVESMKEHLREFDRMLEIRNEKLEPKTAYSDTLTNVIEVARNKPTELLKQHQLPIDGIGVDENGMIRINGVLLDGLSDGEKLEAAFSVAVQRMGELKVICLDGFEKLNETEQKKIVKLCEDADIQAFITITKDTDSGQFEIKTKL